MGHPRKKAGCKSAINIQHVSYTSQAGTTLFSDFTGSIPDASLTLINGPSGCGKTTLLRLLAGLETPTLGTIYFYGKKASTPQRTVITPYDRNIGFLFQDTALWPHMSGREQLQFVWSQRNHPDNTFEDNMRQTINNIGFPFELLHRLPHTLSRGQQQRLALARCLIAKPNFLFLDEPFTGLDQTLRKVCTTFITTQQKKRNTTIVLVTHDMIHTDIRPDRTYSFIKGSWTDPPAHTDGKLAL
jgi:ABC-type Fe3+/spermidine/putrescine transport system ATPase subunit